MDIGTEELSHPGIVGCLARLHLQPMKFNRGAGGGGVSLFNSMGNP